MIPSGVFARSGAVGVFVGGSAATAVERGARREVARARLPAATARALEPQPKAASPLGGAPGVSRTSSNGVRVFRAARETTAPEAFGTAALPYTTTRVAVSVRGTPSDTPAETPVTSYPYRATGKLFSRFGSSWYSCTAALIGPGILVTAAHCVHRYGAGSSGWATSVEWEPATYATKKSAEAPYGTYTSRYMVVPSSYFSGTDTCTQAGVVCNNDIAIVVLKAHKGLLPGERLGWYAYGWNGYSFVAAPLLGGQNVAQVTQLGYPVAFDDGKQMQRTDAVGLYLGNGALQNVQIGSAQTGGASGGPWIVNFGKAPAVDGAVPGAETAQAVIGVTSYLSSAAGFNRLGASWFGQNAEYPAADYGGRGAGNIGFLVDFVCRAPAFAEAC